MGSCNYKGESYSEKEIKPVVSYHYMVEDVILQSHDISKIGNVLQIQEQSDFGDSEYTFIPDVSQFIQSVNDEYGSNSQIVTIEDSGIIDINVNPIAKSIINKSVNNTEEIQNTGDNTQSRKTYNLEGISEETLDDMEVKVSLMESRFAELGVTTHFILDGDLNASGQLLGTSDIRYKDMVASGEINDGDGVIIVNPNILYSDTVFHEYGHLFIDLMGGMKNPRIKYAYSKIQNSALANQVKSQYSELSGDTLAKEIMATAIGKEATEIFTGNNSEIGFIQKFIDWIRNGVRNILGIPVSSVKNLANELLGDSQNILDFDTNGLDTQTQLFKAYTKDTPKIDRIVKGAKDTVKSISTRINIELNTIGNSTQPDKVEFRNTLRALNEDIKTLSNNSSIIAITKFLDTARNTGDKIESKLKELLNQANNDERIYMDFNFLNQVEAYKSLFNILDDIQNSATSGYFKSQLVKEGWGDTQNIEFIQSIDKAKEQFDRIHSLHINVGRHHTADKLVRYSNRSIITRRIQLEDEYKESFPRQDGESRNAYRARIREKVDKTIADELQNLKIEERELIYNRLNSSPADIGSFAQWVSSEKDLNSMIIQLASKLLDDADLKRDLQMQDKKLEAFRIFKEFDKDTSGLGAKEKYKGLYQEGSDGNLYYTSEYNIEWYIQYKELQAILNETIESYGDGSKQHIVARDKRNEWAKKNIVYVTEGINKIAKPTNKWKNKDYSNIMSNPNSPKAKMLNYLLNESIENSKMLHGNRSLVYNAPASDVNFIRVPSIGRNTFEKATDGDVLAGIKDSFERLYRAKSDDENLIGDINSEQDGLKAIANRKGDIRHGVPIYFRGNIPLNEVSYDLMSSHLMDSYMSMNYKYKSGLQIELELMKDIAAEKSVTQTSGIAKQVFLNAFDKTSATEILKKASEQSNELTVLQSLIENRLYGIKNVDTEYAKIADSVMKWSASTMLMFNLPSAMTNILQGKVFNFIESQANEFYNTEDLKRAEADFFKDSKNWINDIGQPVSTSKTKQLLEILNIQGEFKALSSKMVENTRFKALANSSTAYALNHMGEFYMHGTMMYAILNNIKTKNTKGEYIDSNGKVTTKDKAMSLSEAITVTNGKLTMNKYVYKTSHGNSPIGLSGKELGLLEIKGLINKIAHDLHGNYNEEIQNMAQRYTIGKFLLMLRKWIVPGFNKRWRGATYANPFSKNFKSKQSELRDQIENFYSEDLQAFQEGYYTTALRFISNVVKDLKILGLEASTKNWDQLSDREIANMRRFVTEVSIMALSLASSYMLLALAQGIDDDDDEARTALFHLTYYTRRMFSEMQFYSNPIEAFKIMATPAASMAYIAKLGAFSTQLVNDAYNVTFGEGLEEYQTGKRKGEYKLWKRTGDVVPIVNQWNRDIEESTGWLFNVY